MAWLLQQDEELQGVLTDALMRSEQHRENYLRLKSQLEVALHQHKALEGELERSRAEAEQQVCRAKEEARDEVLELRLKLKEMEASVESRKESLEEAEEDWRRRLGEQ